MTDPKPDKPTPPVDYLALRADMVSVILRLERVLEADGKPVESVIVTRRQRVNLTRKAKRK